MNALQVNNLSVAYEEKIVLKDVNLKIPIGRLTGIIGPNGAGKSTLIKAILNQLPNKKGSVHILERALNPKELIVGYVPQRNAVDWDFPTTALDVVLMGRYGHIGMIRKPSSKDKRIAIDCLKNVGMDSFADRSIGQLSGGQQQRVFLARALAQQADVYFMDEPFVGVDAATERTIIAILKDLKSQGKSVFVVHHDLQTAPDYFDWIVLLNQTLVASGPTEQTFTKENLQDAYGGKLFFMDQRGD
ncbi:MULTISPECIES: metal ABC transporter ATP-binding protein [Bacillaceae]|uniref:metal ABC transporter ATP-binding protein n=1 Tax=Bacillaceae TaxID=186817 RepID=UPI0006AFFD45|nr:MULTISPECIES: metal ABC transporter ATP-binding protein [Bacillaceae]ALC87237.1 manganese ABC transporter ATP-binding protein [Bacillus sp. FJAT-22090]KQL34654.1 manganese ABC transporter ATP-binding protein [Psychrobacillus sp. FJAT-21963]